MAKTEKTKRPTGLSIKRKKDTYTASWKIADKDYGDGQTMQIRRGSGWERLTVGTKTKSKAFKAKTSRFYPNTTTKKGKTVTKKKLKSISFRVRGNRKSYTKDKKNYDPAVSAWATKTFTLTPPNQPSISVTTDTFPTAAFAWSVKTDNSDAAVYTRVLIDTVLLQDSNITKGKDVDWSTNIAEATMVINGTSYEGTQHTGIDTDDSGTLTIKEDSSLIGNGHSYTRWVRIIAQGPAGDSEPRYAKHVYAEPNQSANVQVEMTDDGVIRVTFDSPKSASKPIGTIETQWAIETPDADLQCPSGASWSTGKTTIATDETGGAAFEIDRAIGEDECLFIRVNTIYDDVATYGEPVMVSAGALATPVITNLTTNATAHTVTVTATNESAVPDSFMVVRYYNEDEPNGFDIAIIPHGSTTATGIQCPAWTSTPKIGVYAAVGTYTQTTRADGVSQYVVEPKMVSPVQAQGGSIPAAPQVALSSPASGTIRVAWDWTWNEADSAELSWSDHADAWESTDEPETYTITKLHAAAWNISGLETGKTWYVRVRLIANQGDSETYGAYSEIEQIDLSSAPLAPVLTLSDSVITEDGEITASWTYSTTDGTAQAFAEVAQITDGVYTPVAQVKTAQHVTLTGENFGGFQTGETYQLAVRVISGSGRASDAWSDPVAFAIADPPSCTISETSLEQETIRVNPRSFTGDIVTFETEDEEDVTRLSVSLSPIQNLNGYDHPWVGGSGKNKLPAPTASTQSINGITWTINEDGSITARGTATARSILYYLPSGDYGTISTNVKGTLFDENGNVLPATTDYVYTGIQIDDHWGGFNSATLLGNGTLKQVWFSIDTLNVAVDYTIFPILYDASLSVSEWEPYSNICPIYGRTGQNVFVTGVNVWDEVYEVGDIDRTTGQNSYSSMQIRSKNYISVKPSTQYFVCCESSITGANVCVLYYDASKAFLSAQWSIGVARTTPNNCYYMRLVSNVTYGATYRNDISINYPATDHDYHAYTGTTYTRAFEDSLGNELTVYGGEDEIVGGVLTVSKKVVVYDGSSDESWSSEWVDVLGSRSFYTARQSDAQPFADININRGDIRTNMFPVYRDRWVSGSLRVTSGYYNFPVANELGLTSVAEWRTYLSGTPLEICYTLATPQTYQLTANEVTTLIGTNHVWSDAGEVTVVTVEAYEDVLALKDMPLMVTVDGAGESDITRVVIERAEAYHIDRPDETDYNGFEGETIAIMENGEDGVFAIDNDDLIGKLDDGATYRIIATVQDGLGQSATDTLEFMVIWAEQATEPSANIEMHGTAAYLTPIANPDGNDGDVCDIYRLSADRPTLIYEGAEFGETYVDPYPTIGEFGGHRFVTRTQNGDYIMDDPDTGDSLAWHDTDAEDGDNLNVRYNIIDFSDGQAVLTFDADISNSWKKDFKETQYLGGSVQGDWNKAVSRSTNFSVTVVSERDQEIIKTMRRLADHAGICHVRTKDGSSYPADVEVSEAYNYATGTKTNRYQLTITRVDPEELDGMTLAEWQAIHEE